MLERRSYRNAPITEAVLDVRAVLDPTFDPSAFISIFSAEQDAYPIRNNQVTASAEVKFGNEMNVRMGVQQLSGYVYATEDGSKKFQPTLTGFTFNRLAPYDSWEQFSAEALRWVLPRFSGQYV